MKMEIRTSVMCDQCSNAGPGVKLVGKSLCFDCAQDDLTLLQQILQKENQPATAARSLFAGASASKR